LDNPVWSNFMLKWCKLAQFTTLLCEVLAAKAVRISILVLRLPDIKFHFIGPIHILDNPVWSNFMLKWCKLAQFTTLLCEVLAAIAARISILVLRLPDIKFHFIGSIHILDKSDWSFFVFESRKIIQFPTFVLRGATRQMQRGFLFWYCDYPTLNCARASLEVYATRLLYSLRYESWFLSTALSPALASRDVF
jgi:hypothetical protein